MKRIFLLLIVFLPRFLFSQDLDFINYSWKSLEAGAFTDTIKPVDGRVVELERRISEIYLNDENYFEELNIFHQKIRTTTSKAIDVSNKIYIPLKNVLKIEAIKARFISPDGKISDVPEENILQVENLENQGDFKTFVIEGAETGGAIEYFYILRKSYQSNGGFYLQGDEPKANVDVIYSYPSELTYLIKSYNGLAEFSATQKENGRVYRQAHMDYIPAIHREQYAFYKTNLMRFEYTLTYNNYSGALRRYSWSTVCQQLYSNFYDLDKKELKTLNSVLRKVDDPEAPLAVRVRALEGWVKEKIIISNEVNSMSIDECVEYGQNSPYGTTRFLVVLLEHAGIPYELVLTSDIENKFFDPEFNGMNFLEEYLIYIPPLREVLVPGKAEFRMGVMPYNYASNYGLFMHPIKYDENLASLAYDIKKLPEADCRDNADSMFLKLRINTETMEAEATNRRIFNGSMAQNFQAYWENIPHENRKDVISQIFNMGSENTVIQSFNVKNHKPSDIGLRNIIFDVKQKTRSIVELAGDDIIFKIGESIGAQSELYASTERKLPVQIDILRSYYRVIEFEIPEGYSLAEPENLNMNVQMMNNGKESCAFRSKYEIRGNKLIVISEEFYSENEYPKERYEEFRKVINAAADFNKKTVLLVKEG